MTSELLEIYKIHAEIADKLSHRRDSTNRMFVSLLTGNFIFLAACLRFGTETVSFEFILYLTGTFGGALSIAWYLAIREYKYLDAVKFDLLFELEEKLEFPFFSKEWDVIEKNKGHLNVSEKVLFHVFYLAHLGMAAYGGGFFECLPSLWLGGFEDGLWQCMVDYSKR